MSQNKTQPHTLPVGDFIEGIDLPKRQVEAETLLSVLERATNLDPVMWGDNMIGYGTYHYHYASGKQGDYFLTGFSPRKSAISIYIMPGFRRYPALLSKLGKHKHSVSCLYVSRLENIDLNVLEELIRQSVMDMKEIYPDWSPDAFRIRKQ